MLVTSAVLIALSLFPGVVQAQVVEPSSGAESGSDTETGSDSYESQPSYFDGDHGWVGFAPSSEIGEEIQIASDTFMRDDYSIGDLLHDVPLLEVDPSELAPLILAPDAVLFGGYDLGGNARVIPEPVTGVLLVIGAAMLAARRRRT